MNALVRKGFPVLLVVVLAVFFFALGDRSFRNPDEGRYAEIAREMIVNDNWVQPTLYGLDYLRKPVFFYWLLALSFKSLGMSEFSARLVPALFGIFGIVSAYFFAKKYWGQKTAYFSALVLATNIYYANVSRYLLIDSVFAFFLTSAFYAGYSALKLNSGRSRLLFYLLLGLAFLTKGVAALAIPGFVFLVYLTATGQFRQGVQRLVSLSGVLTFLAVSVPWYALISVREPEFLKQFFVHEHFSRFVSKSYEHQEPWFFYLALLPLVFCPWSLFCSPFRNAVKTGRDVLQTPRFFLVVAFAGTLLFFTASSSKLATYLMPVIPFGSILIGDAWRRWTEVERPGLGRLSMLSLILFAVFILSSCFVILSPAFDLKFPSRIPEQSRVLVFIGLLLLIAESSILIYGLLKQKRTLIFYSLIIFLTLVSIFIPGLMGSLNERYTTKHFAKFLAPKLGPSDTVFIYSQPGAFYDFAFYLDRPVKLVGLEGELEFNKADRPEDREELSKAVVTYDQFREISKQKKVYCLLRRSDYDGMDASARQYFMPLMLDERKILVESTGP